MVMQGDEQVTDCGKLSCKEGRQCDVCHYMAAANWADGVPKPTEKNRRVAQYLNCIGVIT